MPTTGRPLVRGAGAGHRAGWDLTLTAPKTLSLLWAASRPEQRTQLEAIHAAARFCRTRKLYARGYEIARAGLSEAVLRRIHDFEQAIVPPPVVKTSGPTVTLGKAFRVGFA